MKRLALLCAGILAATLMSAAPASAAPAKVFCIPESLTLVGSKGSICLMAPTPSIDPPFFAAEELNGSQSPWCIYTQVNYQGAFARIPAFSRAFFGAPIASARPC